MRRQLGWVSAGRGLAEWQGAGTELTAPLITATPPRPTPLANALCASVPG